MTSSTSDRTTNMKNNLDELKNNLNEMKNINFKKIRRSLENLVDDEDSEIPQPLVTYPDDSPCVSEISSPTNPIESLKFEQKTMNNFQKTTVSHFILLDSLNNNQKLFIFVELFAFVGLLILLKCCTFFRL